MRGFYRDLFDLLFYDFDGFQLGPLRRVCKQWKDIIDNNEPYKSLVHARVKFVYSLSDAGLWGFQRLDSSKKSTSAFSRMRKHLKHQFNFDMYAHLNYMGISNHDAVLWYETTKPHGHRARNVIRIKQEAIFFYENNTSWLFAADCYDLCSKFAHDGRAWQDMFPSVFRFYTIAFPQFRGDCMSNVDNHLCFVYGGHHCCNNGQHRGMFHVLEVKKPTSPLPKRVSYAMPPAIKKARKCWEPDLSISIPEFELARKRQRFERSDLRPAVKWIHKKAKTYYVAKFRGHYQKKYEIRLSDRVIDVLRMYSHDVLGIVDDAFSLEKFVWNTNIFSSFAKSKLCIDRENIETQTFEFYLDARGRGNVFEFRVIY